MRVVLTGASGQLGRYVRPTLLARGHEVWGWSRCAADGLESIDITDAEAMGRRLVAINPDVILHLAAISSIEAVRRDPAYAWRVNVSATEELASWCREFGQRIVFTSTDLVFPGEKPWSSEGDPVAPLMEYGRTKAEAEKAILGAKGGLVARLSLLFGPSRAPGRDSFQDLMAERLRRGESPAFFEDEFRTPLDSATASRIFCRLTESDLTGILHVGGPERMSRFELARRSAFLLGLDPDLIRANRQSDMAFAEQRPADVSLDTTKLAVLFPDLRRPSIEEVGWE